MNQECISIAIEGDFIDSFIYSGTLFLVSDDSRIGTYNWESLLQLALHRDDQDGEKTEIYEFLKDCRRGMTAGLEVSEILNIDRHQLENQLISSLALSGWPTDINIYSNRFYIASENGVDELAFDFGTKSLNSDESFRVWNQYAYRVSANDAHRLAIAAGANGVITATPRVGYIKESEDLVRVLEIDSHDCEWIGRNLVANSSSGPYVSVFPPLPDRPKGPLPHGYWAAFEAARRSPPDTRKVMLDGNVTVAYAWIAGRKLFSFLSDGELSVEHVPTVGDSENSTRNLGSADTLSSVKTGFKIDSSILAARSGSFGSIIETKNDLIIITEGDCQVLANRPVGWRVFPRAKNYLNHLHVMENGQLIIRAFFDFKSGSANGRSDRFGISIDDVR